MTRFAKEYSKLNEAQKLAVDQIEGPVLVIAGPGTGKTQLLSMRVANILQKTDTLPQNILCLTFTDSATATLRKRLTNLIGQTAYDVSINTYHSFGSDLIRRMPEYFVDDSDMRPADDLSVDQTYRDILGKLSYSNPLKFSTRNISNIRSMISDFKRALMSPDDVRAIAEANLKFISLMSETTVRILGTIKRMDKSAIPKFAELAEETTDKYTSGTELPRNTRPMHEQWQEELELALEFFDETGKTNEITGWKNNWLAKNNNAEFIVKNEMTSKKLLAMADVYQDYLKSLENQQLFDYDDMIMKVIKGLQTNDDLRYTIQEQYQYIMLDEFQDTNIAQMDLINLLADNPVNEGRPNIMAVGDDDQAIYAFQGAKYSHMLAFYNTYREVKVVTLVENYRSHKDILFVAHGVAEQIESRLHHNFTEISKTLTASNTSLPNKAEIERREFKTDLAEYGWITRQVGGLISGGVDPNEIAILAPQHRYLEPLVSFFAKAGIAIRYDKQENVLDNPIVLELTQMCHLITAINRGDTETVGSLWAEVLSYEYWNLPTSTIWELSWQANDEKKDWTNILLANPSTKMIALFFIRLGFIIKSETLETMLDYIIGVKELDLKEDEVEAFSSPFYQYYFNDKMLVDEPTKFWDLLNNLTVLRQHLREYKQQDISPLNLHDFIDFIVAHRLANIKILNTSPYNQSDNAVQLMTTFKAKGQEFEAVFVIAANDEVWGSKTRTKSSALSVPTNLNFITYGGSNDDERLRLFFVAVTRAKSKLYISNFQASYAGKQMTRLRYLEENEDENGKTISLLLPENMQEIIIDDSESPEIEHLMSYWENRHTQDIKNTDLKKLLVPRLEKFLLSPTHVNSFIDTTYGGPKNFFVNTILRFPKAPTISGQYGNAFHETLEWVHNYNRKNSSLPTFKQLQEQFESRIKSKKMSEQDTKLLIEKGQQSLAVYYKQKSSQFNAENEHEFNFKHEGVFIDDAHLSGKIDQLIINKIDKTIVVVDFKTGSSYSRWTNETKLHKYKQQLYFYKLLVENSHTYAGYKVVDAYLQFVEPNDDNEIIDLHLNFNEAELAQTRKLISKVWQHIMDLDFPATTNYDDSYKGMIQLETDLIDGII